MSIPPRVSVIIATYNRATLLMEAIASVRQQTFGDHEIIVADDGSTDDTATRLAALANEIHYLRLPHSGRPSVTRNRALNVARGEFIAFLDDDDRWLPQKLQLQVEQLAGHPERGFVYCDIRLRHDDGHLSPPLLQADQKRAGFIFEPMLVDCFIQTSMVVARRKAISAVGGFDESMVTIEDYELWLRLAYYHQAAFIDEPLALVGRHSANHSTRQGLLNYELLIEVLEQLPNKLPLNRRQRLLRRRILARRQVHVGLALLARGTINRGRHSLRQAIRLNPFQRQAWLALLASYRRPRHA